MPENVPQSHCPIESNVDIMSLQQFVIFVHNKERAKRLGIMVVAAA